MNFLSAFVTFKNLHEVRRLCHWGPIIALSVIAICSTMAILDSIIWYWPLDTTGGSINFIMLLNWTVLILYNYFNAMFVGPGYIPLGWKPVGINCVLVEFLACRDIDVLQLKICHLFCCCFVLFVFLVVFFSLLYLSLNRRISGIPSTSSTAECAKDTRLPDLITVASATGSLVCYCPELHNFHILHVLL